MSVTKFSRPINLSNLSSDPSGGFNGQLYYNTTTNKIRQYVNGAWADVPTSAGGGIGLIATAPGSAISSNYTVVSGDDGRTLLANSSSGSFTITLPTPSSGFKVTIKDYIGASATNPITIARAGSEKIDDAAANDSISENYKSVSYVSDGTDWFKIASFNGAANIVPQILFAGGTTGPAGDVNDSNVIDRVYIDTLANATDFGDLTSARKFVGASSNSSRAVFAGGGDNAGVVVVATMDYVNYGTNSNATSFGNLSVSGGGPSGVASSTRGVFGGRYNSGFLNTVDYITFSTTGNAIDFGDLTVARNSSGGVCSPIRGVFGGGLSGAGADNTIDYITIASTGNATDFGDLTVARYSVSGSSNSTRGLFHGGFTTVPVATTDYITIATTGNATNFGNLNSSRYGTGAGASSTRSVVGGGVVSGPTASSTIDYYTISTLATASSFGSLSVARGNMTGCSNSHGGL